jgi:Fic/DOC family
MSAHIFVSSTITGESIRYFVPSQISKADFSTFRPARFVERCAQAPVSLAPLAAMSVMRGRAMLSLDVITKVRSLSTLKDLWYGKRLDTASLCSLHASAIGRKSPSCLRDSAVWVDGLRPRDAALVPCPSSMVPGLLNDYFSFMARTDVPHWIRLAIGHYQLLMIHPFFDGNGRLSRLVALLHAQRFVPRMAMAIAAAQALQRRAFRNALDSMRRGDVNSYLAHWLEFMASIETAMEAMAYFGRAAKRDILARLDTSDTSERFVRLALNEPLFTLDSFANGLNISRKLAQSWLDKLVRSGSIEPHVSTGGTQEYRCPIAVEFWRKSMESLASSCMKTHADEKNADALVTSP